MTVETKTVSGRRDVHYASFDDLLADAERLAQTSTKTLGNWEYGQILKHIALAMNAAIDGAPFSLPAPMQWVFRLFLKRKFLTGMSPGFKIPKSASDFIPGPTSVEDGLQLLQQAVERSKSESQRSPNPALGKLSRDESDQFQLRHAEMHMSFVVPE